MSRSIYPVFGLTLSLTVAACGSLHAQTLQSSADALNAANTKTIEYSGSGRWYQFGQAPNPTSAWPQFDVSSFKASINYVNPSERVHIIRSQTVDAGRVRPAPVEQKTDQYLSGSLAWNLNPPPASTKDSASTPLLQPAAIEERTAEIWSTPQGFLKAALANNATSKSINSDLEVSFNIGKYRYVGSINDKNEVTRVQTWIDNPVLGDTLVETNYTDYKTFDGVKFPTHIVRTQGGYPVLDIIMDTFLVRNLAGNQEEHTSTLLAFDELHSRSLSLSVRATALVFEDPVSRRLLEQIERIAPSDATVLIIGETGTGKELVARHVHALSKRSNNVFGALNCAALSENLIESELFGHEKDSFTGAFTSKNGWFETAN